MFDPSTTSRTVSVTIVNDQIVEAEEAFFGTLRATDPSVNTNPDTATVSISGTQQGGESKLQTGVE